MTPKSHKFACSMRWTGAAAGPTLSYKTYSRDLSLEVAGKPALAVSSAPPFLGDAGRHNPEDLLLGALSTCHCLSYLALATRHQIAVTDYRDEVEGTMEWDGTSYHFTEVVLHPTVTVKKGTDLEKTRSLHEDAHTACFIARSVNFPVLNQPTVIEAAE